MNCKKICVVLGFYEIYRVKNVLKLFNLQILEENCFTLWNIKKCLILMITYAKIQKENK